MKLADSMPTTARAPAGQDSGRAALPVRWAPYLLALLFVLSSLRSLPCGNPIDSDAARHAMNGAFLHDLVKSGQLTHPVEYGKQYFSRLPGISLPYHPPLFPAVEAAFFFVFGVKFAAARLAISIAVGICVLLFYRLVLSTHGSHAVAAASVLFFFAWRWTQLVSNDVMLEMPAFVFALAALCAISRLDLDYPLWRGLAFALLAGAAVWTKQTTVFLGVVPFGYALLTRRWNLLSGKTIWISSILFGGIVLTLMLMSAPFRWTGVNVVTHSAHVRNVVLTNLLFYAGALLHETGYAFGVGAGVALIVAAARSAVRRPKRPTDELYVSWALSALGVLLAMSVCDERYLFFVVAPLAVITFAALERLSRAVLGPARAWLPPVAIAAVFAAVGLAQPAPFLRGPEEAVSTIAGGGSARILYCGRSNGAFIFGLRAVDQDLRKTVIRGDKLPKDTFTPANLEQFAHRFGLNYILLERTSRHRPWDGLFDAPGPSMVLVREVPISSSDPLSNGRVRIFRFTNPSPNPEDSLKFRVWRIGRDLEMKF
jgi:hypothetical protein